MAENKAARVAFVAKANVNFSMNVNRYEVIRARNDAMLAELRMHEPMAKLPSWALYMHLNEGQEIKVGDSIVINEANNVVQIPFELFDMYADAKVEQPCTMKGHVEDKFAQILEPLSEERRAQFIREESKMKERFHYTSMMSRV